MRFTRVAATVSAILLSSAIAMAGSGTAQAAEQSAGTGYVALGDSYSSGVGAGNYDGASGDCKRSPNAYPSLWAAANSPSSFSFTACSGATTDTVLSGQLGPLNADTGTVSISVGGNDIGFADVMTTCVLQSESTCVARVDQARAQMNSTLPGKLDAVYDQISSRAPSARVAVLGYPRLYKLGGTCVAGLSEGERTALNAASDDLNSVIAKRAADHGFAFADVAGAFTGHEICSGDSWLHSVTIPVGDSYHPTAAGQSGGYLPAFRSAL